MKAKENKKDKKKDKIPMGKALRYNLLMLGKIWKMSPLFVIITLMTGIVDGISGSVTTVFTYMLFNELDKADVTFGRIALYLLLILGVNAALTLFNAWYHQFYWVKADKKLQFAMHSELFDHAMKMDLACYDDPKFYNDYVWAMDESKGRAINVMNDASGILGYVIQISTLITLMMQVDWVVGLILFVGCILNAVGIIRALVFLNKEKLHADHPVWLAGFTAIYILSYILAFTAFGKEPTPFNFFIELLPVIGTLATTISFRLTDAKSIRRYGLISSPSWLVYNCVNFAIGAIICEVLSLCSITIGIIRLDRKK